MESSLFPEEKDIKFTNDKDLADSLLKCVEVLLMTVNENEYRAVLGLMKPHVSCKEKLVQNFQENFRWFIIGSYGQFCAALIRTQKGSDAKDAARTAIDLTKPKMVISVGVAFGKCEQNQNLGDVLVATMSGDCTMNREEEKNAFPLNPTPPSSEDLVELFKIKAGWNLQRSKDGSSCEVRVGCLLCVPHLIDNKEIRDKYFEMYPKAIGGEMEGAGIYKAVSNYRGRKIDGIVIKAISDWADGKKEKSWQPFAAHAAASYVHHHLNREDVYKAFSKGK